MANINTTATMKKTSAMLSSKCKKMCIRDSCWDALMRCLKYPQTHAYLFRRTDVYKRQGRRKQKGSLRR